VGTSREGRPSGRMEERETACGERGDVSTRGGKE